jgi:hypothetical protein
MSRRHSFSMRHSFFTFCPLPFSFILSILSILFESALSDDSVFSERESGAGPTFAASSDDHRPRPLIREHFREQRVTGRAVDDVCAFDAATQEGDD